MRNDITLTQIYMRKRENSVQHVNAFKLFIAIILLNSHSLTHTHSLLNWWNLNVSNKISDITLFRILKVSFFWRSFIGWAWMQWCSEQFLFASIGYPFYFSALSSCVHDTFQRYTKIIVAELFSCFSLLICVLRRGSSFFSHWNFFPPYIFWERKTQNQFQLTAIKLSTNLFIKHDDEEIY